MLIVVSKRHKAIFTTRFRLVVSLCHSERYDLKFVAGLMVNESCVDNVDPAGGQWKRSGSPLLAKSKTKQVNQSENIMRWSNAHNTHEGVSKVGKVFKCYKGHSFNAINAM